MRVSIAHSPDADDYFLFWALRHELLPCPEFEFSFREMDTEDLNCAAREEIFDVCAVSVAAYSEIADKYLILSSGASVGRNYGPALVSKQSSGIAALRTARIGIPGKRTTAAKVLQRLAPQAQTVEIPLTPYRAAFDALDSGEIDAAVLIHEGQIAFAQHQLHLVTDLGKWWTQETSLPLPLGINVIRKSLGAASISGLARLFRQAVKYSLNHQAEILPELFRCSQLEQGKLRSERELQQYLNMYANEDSVSLRDDCKRAIALLSGSGTPPEFTA